MGAAERTRHEVMGVTLLIGVMAMSLAHRVAAEAPISSDEPSWLASGYLTWQLVTTRATSEEWKVAYANRRMTTWGHMNPPVGKVLIGALVAFARDPSDPVDYTWNIALSREQNAEAGNLPPMPLLTPVRQGISLVGAALLLLAYLCARQVTNPAGAAGAALLLFFSETCGDLATEVYTDVPQMALYLAALLALLRYARPPRRTRWLVLASVLGGLSCATKFSSAAVVATIAAISAVVPGTLRARLLRPAAVGVLALACFIAVNPVLYRNPIPRMQAMVHGWAEVLAGQQQMPLLAPTAVRSRPAALKLVAERVWLQPSGTTAPGWAVDGLGWGWPLLGLLTSLGVLLALRQLRRAGSGSSRVASTAVALVGVGLIAGVVVPRQAWPYCGAVVGGAVILAATLRRDRSGPAAALLLAMTLGLITTVAWLPFDWGRYFFPAICLTSIVGGVGLGAIADLLLRPAPTVLATP